MSVSAGLFNYLNTVHDCLFFSTLQSAPKLNCKVEIIVKLIKMKLMVIILSYSFPFCRKFTFLVSSLFGDNKNGKKYYLNHQPVLWILQLCHRYLNNTFQYISCLFRPFLSVENLEQQRISGSCLLSYFEDYPYLKESIQMKYNGIVHFLLRCWKFGLMYWL